MQRKDKGIFIRVSENERRALKRKAKKCGLTVSEYVRQALIHSDSATVVLLDTLPFEEMLSELRKQGANLNQWMKYLNTYGGDAYEKESTARTHDELSDAYLNITGALIALRKEAERHKVVIDFERYAKLDDDD